MQNIKKDIQFCAQTFLELTSSMFFLHRKILEKFKIRISFVALRANVRAGVREEGETRKQERKKYDYSLCFYSQIIAKVLTIVLCAKINSVTT